MLPRLSAFPFIPVDLAFFSCNSVLFCVELSQRFASPCLRGRVILAFQGVDSAFHVWVNGILVGFAKGSRLPCEFDVTDALRGDGEEQCLCLRVIRWSDGSYLEDQDHWWLSGVYREVELALRPAATRISDFSVRWVVWSSIRCGVFFVLVAPHVELWSTFASGRLSLLEEVK